MSVVQPGCRSGGGACYKQGSLGQLSTTGQQQQQTGMGAGLQQQLLLMMVTFSGGERGQAKWFRSLRGGVRPCCPGLGSLPGSAHPRGRGPAPEALPGRGETRVGPEALPAEVRSPRMVLCSAGCRVQTSRAPTSLLQPPSGNVLAVHLFYAQGDFSRACSAMAFGWGQVRLGGI